jgi:SAM-dependent methyltransferase
MNSAQLYDLIYSGKDYASEAKIIDELIKRYQPNAQSLLDVACGTGNHLEYFKQDYQCKGIDLDPDILAEAKRKHPDVPFYEGDMQTLYMGERFDAVICLFSAIGYVQTRAGLNKAIKAMGQHVARRGVLIVEPWITPENFRRGDKGLTVVETDDVNIVRMNTSKRRVLDGSSENGEISRLEMHYMVGTADSITTFSEVHDLGLFSNEMYAKAFQDAGFELQLDHNGLSGRGLFVGVKSR